MPAKELGRSSTYWDKRRLLKYTANERKSTKYINDIRAMYNKANDDIDKMLRDVYRNYSKDTGIDVQTLKTLLTKSETKKTWKELEKQGLDKYIKANYKSRITRLEQIKAQVYAKAKSVYNSEEIKQTELYKSIINDSYYKAIYDTQMGTGLNFAFSKIDNNMMNTLLSNKWSGRNYSKRIWTNTDILADEVSKIVGGSLLSGKGIELTAREIRDRFGVSKYYAERLVRTETNYYDNQADAMAYEEMGIEEFVPVAVLDNRTSQYCADIDGKHFKYSEMEVGVNFPPFHPNCRCTTRGYLGKDAEKLLTRRARNPITGQNEVISNMTYNEWAKENGLLKPKVLETPPTSLKKRLGFYDDRGILTFIPKDSIITNTKVIAGNEVKTKFRTAEKYAERYGGNSNNYSKVAGKIESDKYIFDIHFVKDSKGNEYDFKIKEKTRKGDKNDRKD